jgi:formate hydrogenlyase subunit 3/multisubunit Na+/H+ antiporter MnhD subunit
MKTFRIFFLLACIVILGFHIYSLDYEDLRFKTNEPHYFGIFAMLFVGVRFLLVVVKDIKSKE